MAKKFPRKFNCIEFLKTPKDDPNRHARVEQISGIMFKIVNLNMPYLGTLNYITNLVDLRKRFLKGEINLWFYD